MYKKNIGTLGENFVADYLSAKGYSILKVDYRLKFGQVDIIARDDKYLCFIEVKFRNDPKYGEPQEAVNRSKQKHICNVSKFYLYSKYKSFDVPVRYDVIAVSPNDSIYTFNWIKNAFEFV